MAKIKSYVTKTEFKVNEYICTGTLELNGVTFFINATSHEEAVEKAKAGEFEHWEVGGAEGINWDMDTRTVEDNT